jgi:hypothetical protein
MGDTEVPGDEGFVPLALSTVIRIWKSAISHLPIRCWLLSSRHAEKYRLMD